MKNSEKQAFPTTAKFKNGNTEVINIQFGLTKLEYACIKLGIPETEDEELNRIIRKSERKRLAGLVLQGMLAGGRSAICLVVKDSLEYTDELLKQLEDND